MSKIEEYGKRLAACGLSIKAIKISSKTPFLWASGYYMPFYNDNRMFLFDPAHRLLITEAFLKIIETAGISFDIIAGTSTAGIPYGTMLAERLKYPFIYIRNKPKDHGLRNQIEGIDAERDLDRKRVVLIEDLISTGGSSIDAVNGIRHAKGNIDFCLSIFDYGMKDAENAFGKLNPPCIKKSILTYGVLIDVAKYCGYIKDEESQILEEWRSDPFGWGEKYGFPKVNKT